MASFGDRAAYVTSAGAAGTRGAQLTTFILLLGLLGLTLAFNVNARTIVSSLVKGGPSSKIDSQTGQLILFWGIGAFLVVALAGFSPRLAYILIAILYVSLLAAHAGPVQAYLQTLSQWIAGGTVSSSRTQPSGPSSGMYTGRAVRSRGA